MSVDVVTGEVKRERPRVQKVFTKPSRTLQAFKGASDIHAIMRKYQSTGDVAVLLQRRPADARYGDFSGPDDYMLALARVREAERLFEELPSDVRVAVDNDPAKLLALVNDPSPEALAQCAKLGLIPESVVAAPEVPAPVAPATPAAVAPSTPGAPAS